MNKVFIDLFAGAGGFGCGFSQAGLKQMVSIEIDKWASETISANSDHHVINEDITKLNTKKKIFEIVETRPDIIIGGPPCQGFSVAGKRKNNDPRNKLFLNYLEWVKYLKPQIFVIENVPGILKAKYNKESTILAEIENYLSSSKYKLSHWVLDASYYGVPQRRKRAFIVGSISCEISAPLETNDEQKFVTVWDAIGDLPFIEASGGSEIMKYSHLPSNEYQSYIRAGCKTLYNHEAMKHTKRVIERYSQILEGKSFDELTEDSKVRKRNGNGTISDSKYHSNYRRLDPNLPSFTIPAHFYSSFIHPFIPRNITAREAARLQSFPDNYIFKGKRTLVSSSLLRKRGMESINYLSQYNQIGNAVPPLLAKKIALHLKSYLA